MRNNNVFNHTFLRTPISGRPLTTDAQTTPAKTMQKNVLSAARLQACSIDSAQNMLLLGLRPELTISITVHNSGNKGAQSHINSVYVRPDCLGCICAFNGFSHQSKVSLVIELCLIYQITDKKQSIETIK